MKAVASYERIHRWVQSGFRLLGIDTEVAAEARKDLPGQCFLGHEKSDVLWQGRKVAGAAQRRTRDGLLIQGSVQPPPGSVRRADWEAAMIKTGPGGDAARWNELVPTEAFAARVADLVATVYAQPAHQRRR